MAAARRQVSELPLVVVATALAIAIPLSVVWALSASEAVQSLALLALIAIALAFAVARIGESMARRSGRQFNEVLVWGWLRGFFYERRLDRAWAQLKQRDRASAAEMAEQFRELSEALEATDPYTSGHSRRVARYCEQIARRLGLEEEQISHLRVAAAVHDVGKVKTPVAILRKPARLTADEFETVKRHTIDGALMVEVLADPRLTMAVRHHHERIDGSGYPEGLAAAQIPIEARIIAVADAFDAMTSNRPYRPARSRHKALTILEAEAGSKLDADAVRALRSPSLSAISVLTTVPERGVAAMGGALNLLSASTAAAIVATIAVVGIGVTNPASVANVVRASQIPGVIEAIVPGGEGEQSKPRADRRAAGSKRGAASHGSAVRPAVTSPSPEATGQSGPSSPGSGAGSDHAGKLVPVPPPRSPSPQPTPSPLPGPTPVPGPPAREPRALDPILDLLPMPLGDAVKDLTDPLLPPAPPS